MGVVQASPHGLMNSAVPFPEWVDVVKLSGGTATTYDVPPGAGFSLITSQAPFYAKVNGTAEIPSADITDGSGAFYVAAGLQCKIGHPKTISFISATATEAIITIGVYRA